jgi:hypothetical protein
MRHHRAIMITAGVAVASICTPIGASADAGPAYAGSASRGSATAGTAVSSAAVRATTMRAAATTTVKVRRCARDFLMVPPGGPARRARPPSALSTPPGVHRLRGTAWFAVASNSTPHPIGYEALLAPSRFACSGTGDSEDELSFATWTSTTHRSQAISAHFGLAQGGFTALCGYLAAAHRHAAASSVAREFGTTVAACRRTGALDMPASAHARGVKLRSGMRAPFAVVIRAPAGTESTGLRVARNGAFLRGHKTTTPTLSVAIVVYRGLSAFVSPQTLDCSLPIARRSTCVRAIQAFASETLASSFRWHSRDAARAGRKVVVAARSLK